jgi:PAS domain S-box-containing protein
MFSSMKTATKVVAGFGIAILIAMLVGYIGYRGISTLSGNLEEISQARLPSVETLSTISQAQTAVKAAERTLLSPTIDAARKQHELDRFQEAKKCADDAWKTFESLTHTEKEAAVWKEFTSAWEKWWKDHEDYVKFAQELKSANLTDPEHTLSVMFEARGALWKLIAVLNKHFKDGTPLTDDDILNTPLAKGYSNWMDGIKTDNTILNGGLREIEPLNTALTASVEKIRKALESGQKDAAASEFSQTVSPNALKIIERMRPMRQEVLRVTKLYNQMNRQALETNSQSFSTVETLLKQLVHVTSEEAADSSKQARSASAAATWTMIGAIVIGAAGMLLLGFFIAKSISKVVRTLIGEANRLSQAAVEGRLQTRGNPDLVNSEFRPIVEGINATLDSLMVLFDRVPAPIVVMDKQFKIHYINDAGANVIGLDKNKICGTKCYDQFKTPHCQTASCACARAMRENQIVSDETQAHPGGHNLDIAYSGIPMRDRQGKVIGVFEVVTDLTAIKSAERVAKKVADYQNAETAKFADNLARCAQGDLAVKINIATGDADTAAACQAFTTIGNAMSQLIGSMRSLAADVKSLSASAVIGQLDRRADEGIYQGEYREIIRGMNQMLEGFVTPMNDIAAVLKRMANKDFTEAVETEYPGAYGELRGDVNAVVTNIRNAVEQITESANQFGEGARVIAESSQSLATGAQTQSSSVEEMSASIEELARSVDAVKDNATSANKVANEANQLAEEGGKAVQKSVESMELIRSSSQQISEIIQVISEIASQTNLLALNAAIEAARAGEHGMGFAVVADEVRKLAERSNQAAREISTLIKESTNRVEEGAQLSDQTGESLKQIIAAAEATAAKIAEIATATVQQAANAAEVSKAIQSVAQITEQSAAGSEEMASSSEELGAQSSALRELVGAFNVGISNH